MESATATSEQGGPRSSAKPPTYLPPPPARERPFPPDAESSIKPRLGRAILNSSALISFRCFLLLLPPYPATPPGVSLVYPRGGDGTPRNSAGIAQQVPPDSDATAFFFSDWYIMFREWRNQKNSFDSWVGYSCYTAHARQTHRHRCDLLGGENDTVRNEAGYGGRERR